MHRVRSDSCILQDGWQMHPQELVDWTSPSGQALLQALHAYVLQRQIPLLVEAAGYLFMWLSLF